MKARLATSLTLTALLGTGCIAAVAAAAAATFGAIQYKANGAEQDYNREFRRTFDASVAALRKLGYELDGDPQPGPTEGEIRVDDVKLYVTRQPEGKTRVEVRVGTFDTEDHRRRATLILEEITAALS